MIARQLWAREFGLRGCTMQPRYDGLLESFECTRLDEYNIEGKDQGELIPPLACSFSKVNPDNLAIVDEDGGLIVVDTLRHSATSTLHDWLTHTNAVFDVDWMPGENCVITASGDQSVALWDVLREERVSTFRGHTSSVKVARFKPDSRDIFASGSRDGHVMVWDRRVAAKEGSIGPVLTISSPHYGPASSNSEKKRKRGVLADKSALSVTAVLFHDENTLISTGSIDGAIKFWDLRRPYSSTKSGPLFVPKHQFSTPTSSGRSYGMSSLVLDSSGTRLFASCLDSAIYQFDCAAFTPDPVAAYRGHLTSTFYVKVTLSPDDRYLLTGSSDNNARVYSVGAPAAPPVILTGHQAEVSSVAWCPADLGRIVTLSDDNTAWVWRLGGMGALGGTPQAWKHEGVRSVVGTASREATVKIMGALRVPPTTPRKGCTLPAVSPPKVSSSLRQTISSLHRPPPPPSSTKLISPAITKFFSKPQPLTRCRPMFKASPRKLIITPKKSAKPEGTTVGIATTEFSVGGSVKRKLCIDDDGRGTKAKKSNVENDFLGVVAIPLDDIPESLIGNKDGRRSLKMFSSENLESMDGERHVLNVSTLRMNTNSIVSSYEKIVLTTDDGDDQKIARVDGIESLSRLVVPANFSSPTSNLPNSVLDPKPSAAAMEMGGKSLSKTPDWLTQLRIVKQQGGGRSAERLKGGKSTRSPSTVKKTPAKGTSTAKPITPKTATR